MRAMGLGLMILILKFLMSEVYVAMNGSLVQMFNTAGLLFGNLGNVQTGFDASYLIPR